MKHATIALAALIALTSPAWAGICNPITGSSACDVQSVEGFDAAVTGVAIDDLTGGIFGITDWTLADVHTDQGLVLGITGDQKLLLSTPSVAFGADSGTWSLNTFGGYADVMLVFEDSHTPTMASFLLDQSTLSGEWERSGWDKISTIVEASVWYSPSSAASSPSPVGVPEPSALFLLLTGLLGLFAISRKKHVPFALAFLLTGFSTLANAQGHPAVS